jgi:imidazolonepropionase-like amidohydrolase
VAFLPASDTPTELKAIRRRLAELVRAGLPREDALKGVTIHVAKVLGLEDRLGTIEKGKDADLVFLDGDPLAVGTRVTRVMTCGETAWEAPRSR